MIRGSACLHQRRRPTLNLSSRLSSRRQIPSDRNTIFSLKMPRCWIASQCDLWRPSRKRAMTAACLRLGTSSFRTYTVAVPTFDSHANEDSLPAGTLDYPSESVHEELMATRIPPAVLAQKPWLDVNAPLQLQVNSFLSAPTPLHPVDCQQGEVYHLVKQCCVASVPSNKRARSEQPLQCLNWAQDIVERLCLEKREQVEALAHLPSPVAASSFGALNVVSIKLWDVLVFGWARQYNTARRNYSSTSHILEHMAPKRMLAIMERAIQEAIWDEEHQCFSSSALKKKDLDKPDHFPNRDSRPTVDIFNTYLYGLLKSSATFRSAPLEASATLDLMQDLHTEWGWHCRPNTKSYTHALGTCATAARSHHFSDAMKVEAPSSLAMKILKTMQMAHDAEKQAYQAQYRIPYNTHTDVGNRRRIVTADTVAFTTAMQAMVNALSTSSRSELPRKRRTRSLQKKLADQVLELLHEMIDCSDGSVLPDSNAFLMAHQAFARLAGSQHQSAKQRIDYARICETILKLRMDYVDRLQHEIKQDRQDGQVSRKAGAVANLLDPCCIRYAYNVCLDAWSESDATQAVQECERILQSMLAPDSLVDHPDTVSLHACMQAWLKSSSPYAADRAFEMVQLQHELMSAGLAGSEAQPDFQTYALLIRTLANSGNYTDLEAVQRARSFLEEMVNHVQTGSVRVFRNPGAPFTAVLTVARQRFKKYSQLADFETTGSDGSTSMGSINPFDTHESLDNNIVYSIAIRTYEDAKHDTFRLGVKPDHHLYAAMLRLLSSAFPNAAGLHCSSSNAGTPSLPLEPLNLAYSIMADAKESGQLSRLVVNAWTDSLGMSQNESVPQLLGDRKHLPRHWIRNVPPEFRYIHFGRGRKPITESTE